MTRQLTGRFSFCRGTCPACARLPNVPPLTVSGSVQRLGYAAAAPRHNRAKARFLEKSERASAAVRPGVREAVSAANSAIAAQKRGLPTLQRRFAAVEWPAAALEWAVRSLQWMIHSKECAVRSLE